MNEKYKIVNSDLGDVGLSNAALLAKQNEVFGVDISQDRVNAMNSRQSLIVNVELSKYLAISILKLSTSTDLNL